MRTDIHRFSVYRNPFSPECVINFDITSSIKVSFNNCPLVEDYYENNKGFLMLCRTPVTGKIPRSDHINDISDIQNHT